MVKKEGEQKKEDASGVPRKVKERLRAKHRAVVLAALQDEMKYVAIKKALTYLKSPLPYDESLYPKSFSIADLGVPREVVKSLVSDGVFVIAYQSNKNTEYNFFDVEIVEEVIEEFDKRLEGEESPVKRYEIPDDFFDDFGIIGYDEIKKILVRSLREGIPANVLLVGPPATAKSLFLMALERLEGSVFIQGGTSTQGGIRDVIMGYLPSILLIDEIDKIRSNYDVTALLTWMWEGRVVSAQSRRAGGVKSVEGRGWVVAAANDVSRLHPALKDRFIPFYLKEYARDEYEKVVFSILVREGVDDEIARFVARETYGLEKSVRQAIQVGRLAGDMSFARYMIEALKKHARST